MNGFSGSVRVRVGAEQKDFLRWRKSSTALGVQLNLQKMKFWNTEGLIDNYQKRMTNYQLPKKITKKEITLHLLAVDTEYAELS